MTSYIDSLEEDSPLYLKSLKDTSCRYLETSAKCFQDFINSYNSGNYGRLNQSMADFYKAWDSLYQSMIIQWGKIIRESDKEYPILGKIISITDFINARSKNKIMSYSYMEQKEIGNGQKKIVRAKTRGPIPYPPFSAWDAAVIPPYNVFHNLNLLRELRNASEHDFLERSQGSYNALVKTLNPYISPLIEEFLSSYEFFYAIVKKECHNNRTIHCNKKTIPQPGFLKSISHLPVPIKDNLNIKDEKSFSPKLGAIIREYLKMYATENKKCIIDPSLDTFSLKMSQLPLIVQKYKYTTLTSVLREVNRILSNEGEAFLTEKQMRTFVKKRNLKTNIKYSLCLETEEGTKRFYSTDLVQFLYENFR